MSVLIGPGAMPLGASTREHGTGVIVTLNAGLLIVVAVAEELALQARVHLTTTLV